MLVSKANENYTSGADCAIWRWNGGRIKNARKKAKEVLQWITMGLIAIASNSELKKKGGRGDQRTGPSLPFLQSSARIHTSQQNKIKIA